MTKMKTYRIKYKMVFEGDVDLNAKNEDEARKKWEKLIEEEPTDIYCEDSWIDEIEEVKGKQDD